MNSGSFFHHLFLSCTAFKFMAAVSLCLFPDLSIHHRDGVEFALSVQRLYLLQCRCSGKSGNSRRSDTKITPAQRLRRGYFYPVYTIGDRIISRSISQHDDVISAGLLIRFSRISQAFFCHPASIFALSSGSGFSPLIASSSVMQEAPVAAA